MEKSCLISVILLVFFICSVDCLTDLQVIQAVFSVFPPLDGSSMAGSNGTLHIQHVRPILNRVGLSGCPVFTTSFDWPYDEKLFLACMWAVLGKFANEEINNGGAFGIFALDTSTGTIMRGAQDASAAQSITILSVLIIILLLAIGGLMAGSPTRNDPSK